MRYTIRIKRQENKEARPFWQEFEIEAEGELSIAAMLNELNARQKLTDKSGKEAEPISWECGCMVKKCRGMCDANQWSARTCLFYIFAISKGKSNCTGTFE